jgi:hypothetical protein
MSVRLDTREPNWYNTAMTTTTTTSRYGDPRKTTNHGDGWYTIEGKAHYYRVGMNEDNTEVDYFDPEGGSFISVGSMIDNRKIVSIIVEKAPQGFFKIRLETEEVDPTEADENNKKFRTSNMK